jgi:uncharacterized protein
VKGQRLNSPGRWVRWILAGVFLVGLGIQVIAYRHAGAMVQFVPGARRSGSPESLSLSEKLSMLVSGVTLPRPVNRRDPASLGFRYQTRTVTAADGTPLEVWQLPATQEASTGDNPPPVVLMFHGYISCKADLLPVAAEFHAMGFEVWMVDFRGSGGSGGMTTSIGFHEAEDVIAVDRESGALFPDRPRVLFGSSMGAAAILRAASLGRIDAHALILECPFDRLLTTVANRCTLMGLPQFPIAHSLVFWGGFQLGFDGFAHNPEDYAARVRIPTLHLHGGGDTRVRLEEAERIRDRLGSHGTWVLFPELGHQSYAVAAPGPWRLAVQGFLDRHLAQSERTGPSATQVP